ncbi:hypothetical protein HAX54_022632 [Datura stramonium]|uniref:Uncharacterized protein n=1 Tax=Datura stramonium TaxID=4076 RepID=A0ABS8UWQ9_DATST|nr:hypothetical protein [Datura stramonium]
MAARTPLKQTHRMQTRNGPHTLVQGSRVGSKDGPTTSGRIPETPVPKSPSLGTSEVDFKGAIHILTQFVATQSGR